MKLPEEKCPHVRPVSVERAIVPAGNNGSCGTGQQSEGWQPEGGGMALTLPRVGHLRPSDLPIR